MNGELGYSNEYIKRWYYITDGVINFYGNDEDTYEDVELQISRDRDILKELKASLNEDEFISKEPGLASFVDENFREEINSIILSGVGFAPDSSHMEGSPITTTFEVTFNRRNLHHTDKELDAYLKDFILGQCSDGWGEGFEQWPFYKGYCAEAGIDGEFYFSPWTPYSDCGVDE